MDDRGHLRNPLKPPESPLRQQRAFIGPQRALSLRRTGAGFKTARESSQDGVGPHRLTESPPRIKEGPQVGKFLSGQWSAFEEEDF